MQFITVGTAAPVFVRLVQAADNETGLGGLTGISVTVAKATQGAGFVTASPSVDDLGSGTYRLNFDSSVFDTVGPISIRALHAQANHFEIIVQVIDREAEENQVYIADSQITTIAARTLTMSLSDAVNDSTGNLGPAYPNYDHYRYTMIGTMANAGQNWVLNGGAFDIMDGDDTIVFKVTPRGSVAATDATFSTGGS